MKDKFFFQILKMPALTVISLLVLIPITYLTILSFSQVNLRGQIIGFVGTGNYLRTFQDPKFWTYFRHTLYFTIVSVGIGFIISLILALALNEIKIKRTGLLRVLILLPWLTPLVLSGLIWQWVYNGVYGLLNDILFHLKIISSPVYWLSNPSLALFSVTVVDIWAYVPFGTIILLAGLQSISDELEEAARIDGAGYFQLFKFIKLPLLKSSIMMVLIIRTLFSLRAYDLFAVLTGGGPIDKTKVLSLYIRDVGIVNMQANYASAISIILLLFSLIAVILYLRIFRI